MPVIKPTCLRDLKMRVNIVDVISRVVSLKRAGARMKGLCPFHNEKSPSFHVNPDMGVYHCFGCGKSGDAISFVRETEQLGFTEAVEALGQRFSIPIEYEEGSGPTKEERSLRQEIFDLHEQAADHYHTQFKTQGPAGDAMRAYWTDKRKFTLELADEFKIGVSALDESALAARLLKRKYSEDALRQCGLFFVRDAAVMTIGSLKPRFRGRLMIPIRDHQGRVVAFTARQTELTPKDEPSYEAKYINSPETPIFTKGHLLFNLDRARTAVGDDRPFVLVEGQLDALRCWSVGLKTAIAPQGTAITETQLQLIRRYHSQVECFFDSDSAGQKASLRLIPMALKAAVEVRFLSAGGDGKIDPDLLFQQEGLAAYERLKTQSVGAMAYACRAHLPHPNAASPEEKNRAAQEILSIIAASDREVARQAYLQEVARYLNMPAPALARDFAKITSRAPIIEGHSKAPAPAPARAGVSPENHLLMLVLHYEDLGKRLSQAIPSEWIDLNDPAGHLLNIFLAEFEAENWPGRDHLDQFLQTPDERALIAKILFSPPTPEDPKKSAEFGVTKLRDRFVDVRMKQIDIELALATDSADSNADPISLFKEKAKLQQLKRAPFVLPAAG